MKNSARTMVVLALVSTGACALVSCKKPPEPTPEPQVRQTEITQSDAGTTTTFAPPAPEPQAPAANAAE